MNLWRALFVTAVVLTLSACGDRDSSSSSQGQGTVTITGAVEKSVSFGGKDTRVGCFQSGASSYMRLYFPGTSASSTEMREGLKIEFKGGFPSGNYIFRHRDVSYTLEDARFITLGNQCSINISRLHRKIYANLSCLDMQEPETGRTIAVVADFDCTVAE